MTAKFSASRKRAFLTYLSQTGNQTLSAERAKVSRSWVCLHRSTDAAFDAACREAIEVARERLRDCPHSLQPAAGSGRPPDGPLPGAPASSARHAPQHGCALPGRGAKWRYLDGHELVVRGTGGAGGGKRVQVGRARLRQWTPRVEQRFLTALAATCNVKAACREVGLWPPSAYNHRNRWPAFARAWDEAIDTGYVRIEMALVEKGCNLFSGEEDGPEAPLGPMSVGQAIHILHMHKHQVKGIGKRPGLPPRVATPEEAEKELKKAVKRVESLLRHNEGRPSRK